MKTTWLEVPAICELNEVKGGMRSNLWCSSGDRLSSWQWIVCSALLSFIFLTFAGSVAAAPSDRGFQVPLPSMSADLLDDLKDNWKVNYIRAQIGNNAEMDGTVGDAYIQMMEEQFALLDEKLPLLAERGLKLTFVLYSPPGGFEFRSGPSHHAMYSSRALQLEFIQMWRQIMARYGSNPTIRSFVLSNEPAMRKNRVAPGAKTWNGLLLEAISAIRETHPTVALEVPGLHGSPIGLADLPPISDPNVSYYFNSYLFHGYQHSGVEGIAPFSIPAPNGALGKLRQKLAPFYLRVYDRVQKRVLPASAFPPRINVGEVAVAACATDSGQFLNQLLGALEADESTASRKSRADRIAEWQKKRKNRRFRRLPAPVFTRNDFLKDVEVRSYALHAFAEAPIWDPRYVCSQDGSLSISTEETDRGTVLKSYFGRNA